MKVVIDNNVVIDAFGPNPEFERNAKEVFRLINQGSITPYLCANSMTDIFYVLRKTLGVAKAKETIRHLLAIMDVVPLTGEDGSAALAMPMNDFEDALIAVCAEKVGADCIVTRDEGFLKAKLKVKTLTPGELIEKVKGVK